MGLKPIDPNVLLPWLRQMEFRTLGTRMAQKLEAAQPATVEVAVSEPVVPEIAPFVETVKYALIDTLDAR